MSFDQSPLATSCGASMCGRTVYNSGDKSRDSGMAISLVGRQVCLDKLVFAMIVTLSAYLLSPRLSGVLEVDTSVKRRFSTIVGEHFVSCVYVLGSGNGEQTYPGMWFLPVWYGESQTMSCCCGIASASRAAAHCFLCFVYAVG